MLGCISAKISFKNRPINGVSSGKIFIIFLPTLIIRKEEFISIENGKTYNENYEHIITCINQYEFFVLFTLKKVLMVRSGNVGKFIIFFASNAVLLNCTEKTIYESVSSNDIKNNISSSKWFLHSAVDKSCCIVITGSV